MSLFKHLRAWFAPGSSRAIGFPRSAAPVIDSPVNRETDEVFRRSGDGDNVYRLSQGAPAGLPRKLFEFVPVAGVSRDERPDRIVELIAGRSRRIELEPEPTNRVDPNAIKVIAHWESGLEQSSAHIGYLPADVAKEIAEHHPGVPVAATVKAMYAPTQEKNPGVRLEIWGPRRAREEAPGHGHATNATRGDAEWAGSGNLEARDLERQGCIDEAIALYESSVADGFTGNFPYDRLAILYRRKKRYDDEIRVLRRGIEVFETRVSPKRRDRLGKLSKFRKRLEKAEALREAAVSA